MAHYKISDVAIEISQRENNPKQSEYTKFVGLEHYVSGEVLIRNFGSTERLDSSMKVFHKGDILVARRNVYLKRASTVDFDGLTSGDSIVLRAKKPQFARVLPFVLNTDDFWNFANQYSDGTMSKRLSPKTLLDYEFDLPEDELDVFTDILWSIDETREAYKKLIKRTDDLVKSQFIEMFGKMPTIALDSIADISAGQSSPYDEEFSDTGTPFIKAGNLEDLKLRRYGEEKCNLVREDVVRTRKLKIHAPGTVLIAKSGMSCLSGHVYALKNPAYVVSHLACIEPLQGKCTTEFLRWFFITYGVKDLIKDPSYPSIQLGQLAELQLPNASMELQNEFTAFATQSDKSKFELEQALAALTATYKRIISEKIG